MSRKLRLFWWSPRKSPRLFRDELHAVTRGWMRLAMEPRGRFLKNFGDEFSPIVVAQAFGAVPRWASMGQAELVAIGSVLEIGLIARGQRTYWGTGARSSLSIDDTRRLSRGNRFLAVRGPLTRDLLGLPQATPLGDPGLLVRTLVRRESPEPGKTAIIPHFSTWASWTAREDLQDAKTAGYRLLNPTMPPMAMAREVASCEFVLASSLHGIIFAHAIGIPVVPIKGPKSEPTFKYEDYYTSIRERYTPHSLKEALDPAHRDRLLDLATETESRVKERVDALCDGLLESATGL